MRKLGAEGALGSLGAPGARGTAGLADNEINLEKLRAGRGSATGARLGSDVPGSAKGDHNGMKYSVQALEDTARSGRMDREKRGADIGSALGSGSLGEASDEDVIGAKIDSLAEEMLSERLGTSQRRGRAGIRADVRAPEPVIGDGSVLSG